MMLVVKVVTVEWIVVVELRNIHQIEIQILTTTNSSRIEEDHPVVTLMVIIVMM